ncbi:MAG: hypothetical protein UY82_C0014G0005 [Candidatus Uhrbacteria bacterium GW2011_GWC2_53_7]|uniref:Acylphosphatase-like domain-containing protein n=1 Tax=Candidatus Uhrbacteria bacterium GW2011_GWC2_53_7 TaxID=1618986 RepID=A0A0G2A748_9BACT|nr:MAG: hypothetical protein UY82_C0014G0005 [Candidatus Uhrbacteria bacterium GW2011_GWC2_53_7]
MQRLNIRITGSVQGVFFRRSAKEFADELVLSGWAVTTAVSASKWKGSLLPSLNFSYGASLARFMPALIALSIPRSPFKATSIFAS